jgi:hypothetical protein
MGSTLPAMTKRLPFTVLVAALLLAAACGTPSATPSAHPSANPVAVYHQLAQCVRDHGLPDFPDPDVDAQGSPHFPPDVPMPPQAVIDACAPILNQLPASQRPTQTTPEDPAMMRRFAACMRAHGIDDWPDPNADGSFTMPPSLGNIKVNPRWDQIRAAWDGPCKQYDPTGHLDVTG